MSRGDKETDKLRVNIEHQLNRLLCQLQDLQELQDELEQEEIDDIRADTMQQMQEFEASLGKLVAGDVTLVDALGHAQLAIQVAISKAFKTPEVIQMFAKKDLGSLRNRIGSIQVNARMGKISKEDATSQTVEVLVALKKLGEKLSPEEDNFLRENRSQVMADFDKVGNEIGSGAKSAILSSAASQIKRAKT